MTRYTIEQHHQPAGACASPKAVVFVFDDLHDWQTLAAAAPTGAEVVVLDGWSDGLAQMATHLQGRSGIAALHVLSHGAPGSLLLGSLQLTAAALHEPAHAQALATIGQALAEEGDILVYGCRAGAGELGADFVQALALATGAHVAAATGLVGTAHLGGSWALDRQQGAVGTAALSGLARYQGVLAVPPDQTFTAAGNVKVGTGKSFDYNGLRYTMTGSAPDASYEHYTTSDAVLTPRPAGGSYLALDYIVGAGVSQVTVSAVDGSAFRLMGMSFMVSESAATNATSVQYTLTPQGGAAITTYMTDVQYPQVDFSSNPDFYNITSFTFSASAPGYPDIFVSLDDIVFATPLLVSNAPTLTATGGSPTFTEGGSVVDLFSTVTAATNDAGQTFSGMALTVSNVSNGASEILTIGGTDVALTNGNSGTLTGIGSYSVSVVGGTATVTVSGMTRTDAQMGTLIDDLSYRNASQDPSATNRVVTITNITDSGGSNNTAAPGLASTVSITPVNDAPTASAAGGTPTYTENGAAVTLFSGAAISTIESGQTITAMRFTVTNLADGASEQLVFDGTAIGLTHGNSGTTTTNSLSYAVTVAAGTATVTLTKAAGVSTATAQTLLQGVAYQNTSDAPTTAASRAITLTSIDDNGGTANGGTNTTSLAIAATVTVVAVNDAPTLFGGPVPLTATNEHTTSSAVTVSTLLGSLTHGDADSGAVAGIAITGSTGNGTWQYSTDGTSWTAAGTVGNASALLLTPTTQLRFVPDGLNGGAATLTFRAWDQTSGSASTNGIRSTADTTTAGGTAAYSAGTAQATLTVSSLNDAPVAVNDSIAVAEGGTATVLASSATSVLANDSDADLPADTLTAVLVTGPSQGSITLNPNGTFSYTHNGSDNLTDSFTYQVSDGMALSNVATVNITVTNVNDAPTLATPIANQNATTGIAFPFTFAANTFADTDAGDTLTYSAQLTGGGALPAWLSFDPATRSFSGTPGAGDAGTMSVRVTATDTGALSAHSDFTLTVINAPADPGPGTPPPTTVDGVPVTTTPGPGGSTIITIPVVLPTRPDTPGTGTPLADIPLVTSPSGSPIVSVSVPTGVGLSAEGLTTTTAGSAALAELGFRIERVTGNNPELTNAGQVFYATLSPTEPLSVQILKPTIGAGYDGSQPLVINGSANPADGKQAVIIDARALPSGTVIQVDNIEFVAVVGNVRVIGGAGQNMASGDSGNQWIVLGPDDDIIHGGAGNDTVGSEAGDDQVFGDAGDDIVFGGAGNDLLSGGTGSDRLNGGTGFDVAIQEGARTDYTVTLEGAGIKLTHTASGVADWLVDVEQVRFATGPSLTVAHSAAEEAGAYLFQKWLGRDLTQGEGAIIQTLAGQSAEQVATLFAQLFPTQTAGKTAAQLLEGMASAGAIRVDAVRDVIVNGDAGNNTITPTLGLARYVDGGAGTDTMVVPASLGQTHVQHNANSSYTLQRMTDGAMLDVTNVERVSFSDTRLALDLNGNAGQAAKLLGALAGPGMLANKGIVGEVIRLLDAGASSQTIAGLGLQLLGANTPTQIAQTLWTNVTGRAGTDGELKLLTDIMAGGVSASELVVMAANLEATAVRIDLVGLTAKGIEFA